MFILLTTINKAEMNIFTLLFLHTCPFFSSRVSPKSENTRAQLFHSCYILSKSPPIPLYANAMFHAHTLQIVSCPFAHEKMERRDQNPFRDEQGWDLFECLVEAAQFEQQGSQRDPAEAEPGCTIFCCWHDAPPSPCSGMCAQWATLRAETEAVSQNLLGLCSDSKGVIQKLTSRVI